MFPGRFKKLKIFAPDRYDLVLSELERNSAKDQGDVGFWQERQLDPKMHVFPLHWVIASIILDLFVGRQNWLL